MPEPNKDWEKAEKIYDHLFNRLFLKKTRVPYLASIVTDLRAEKSIQEAYNKNKDWLENKPCNVCKKTVSECQISGPCNLYNKWSSEQPVSEGAVKQARADGMLGAYEDALGIIKDIEIKTTGHCYPSFTKEKIHERIEKLQKKP